MGKKSRFLLVYIALALVAVILLSKVFHGRVYPIKNYSQFKDFLRAGYVTELEIGREEIIGKLELPLEEEEPIRENDPPVKISQPAEPPSETRTDEAEVAFLKRIRGKEVTFSVRKVLNDTDLPKEAEAAGIPYRQMKESDFNLYFMFLLPILLVLIFWFLLFRQSQAGRTAMAFGRSKARLYAEKVKGITFEDVAGCEEAKEELHEIVDFLRNPKKYQNLGGRMPKGVLLVGPPGTGKTLIARAVAGEAKRPFFSLSGSEFVEMFVGVGAARVRDLFQQAKDSAPCIVFIDELDAVGRHRGAGLGGGHDEREQTLNQLLVEMDGFDVNSGVIILAATNRPDVLDPALLRPGRFDRQVVIDAPDLRGREAILKIHARDKPLGDDVDLHHIAAATPGFTGADLANVLNEAALLGARRNLETIRQDELDEATERVIAGPERKSRRLSDEERKRVAYHESGHAMVAALSKHADPVRKISIVPRGHAALGYTMQMPDEDRYLVTRVALMDRLKTLLAGRAAERLVFGEISTGAQDDLNKASEIARAMVCRFGMSDKIGPVALGREHRQPFLGRDIAEERNYSEQTAIEIDSEVRNIIEEADTATTAILKKHRECLEHIAETLLEKEVLQGDHLADILERELAGHGVDVSHLRKPVRPADKPPGDPLRKREKEEPQPDPASLKEGWAPSS